MGSGIKVLFANNYPMPTARRLFDAGEYPRQHLWGALHLEEAGMDVEFVPFDSSRRLRRLTEVSHWRVGDLAQQVQILTSARGGTVCYAADQHSLKGLAGLRRLRAWRHPIVAVVHHEPANRMECRLLAGFDHIVCLSERVASALVRAIPRAAPSVLPWGPALEFAGYVPTEGDVVVSAGKTNRDVETLAKALDEVGARGRVYMLDGAISSSPNIDVVPLSSRPAHLGGLRHRTFIDTLDDLRAASIVAIPLADPDRLSGLSELNDALALRKPIVMTRCPYIDVDIEAIGCGIWVERGDVDGWRAALGELTADPQRRREMGERGRRFAEASWNADLFGDGVVDVVRGVADR